jgi:hypothetical protein
MRVRFTTELEIKGKPVMMVDIQLIDGVNLSSLYVWKGWTSPLPLPPHSRSGNLESQTEARLGGLQVRQLAGQPSGRVRLDSHVTV